MRLAAASPTSQQHMKQQDFTFVSEYVDMVVIEVDPQPFIDIELCL